MIDITRNFLKPSLNKVMGNCKQVRLDDEVPESEPDKLFLYCDGIIAHRNALEDRLTSIVGESAERKTITETATHLQTLLNWMNEDYEPIMKTIYPMLRAGNIT
jgi:hypothetical protein